MYAADAARARGAYVQSVSWPDFGDLDPDDATAIGAWVGAQAAPVLDQWPTSRPVLIGKSLGVYACALAADRGLPAVWLTPHQTDPWIVEALRAATAPMLLIGGTADDVW